MGGLFLEDANPGPSRGPQDTDVNAPATRSSARSTTPPYNGMPPLQVPRPRGDRGLANGSVPRLGFNRSPPETEGNRKYPHSPQGAYFEVDPSPVTKHAQLTPFVQARPG